MCTYVNITSISTQNPQFTERLHGEGIMYTHVTLCLYFMFALYIRTYIRTYCCQCTYVCTVGTVCTYVCINGDLRYCTFSSWLKHHPYWFAGLIWSKLYNNERETLNTHTHTHTKHTHTHTHARTHTHTHTQTTHTHTRTHAHTHTETHTHTHTHTHSLNLSMYVENTGHKTIHLRTIEFPHQY